MRITPTLLAICFAILFFAMHGITYADIALPFSPDQSGQPSFTPRNDMPVTDETGAGTGGHLILAEILLSITDIVKYLLGTLAIIFLVFGGMRMVTAGGDDEQVEKGKRGVTWGVLGLVFALMADDAIFTVFYGGGQNANLDNTFTTDDITNRIDAGTQLLLDALNWVQGVIVIGAVGYIIFSGARMIAALGNEETISKQRTVFLWVGVGLVVLALNRVLVQEVLYPIVLADTGQEIVTQYTPNATRGIEEVTGVITYFLRFLAVIAFAVLVYGGIRMITGFGNDDAIESGKKIITGALIGIVIILMSFVVVSSLVTGNPGG